MLNHNPNSAQIKFCPCCEEEKPVADFTIDRRKKSGLDSYCRACKAEKRKNVSAEKWREYHGRYRKNHPEKIRERWAKNNAKYGAEHARRYRERHPDRARDSRNRQRQEKRDWIANYKAERGCQTCGIKDHRVLDLHHVNGSDKEMAVSQMVDRASWKAIKKEASKCEVLCANCHRIAHYEAR